MKKIRKFLEDNMLMLAGMLLMLASAGVDGKFLSMWMSASLAWLGYVLNFVSDASGYVLSNAYGRLSADTDKRKLARLLLVGEYVNILYSWLFSYLVLRERFRIFYVNPIFDNLRIELEVLSFVSAGFVPLLLVFLGYADALNKTSEGVPDSPDRLQALSNKIMSDVQMLLDTNLEFLNESKATLETSATIQAPTLESLTDDPEKRERLQLLLEIVQDNPKTPIRKLADALNVSNSTVYSYLNELEDVQMIHRNGEGVKVLVGGSG